MKHSASRPKTPSTDTTSGVNEAHRASAASLYFLFFSSSTDDRIEATSWCKYDGASVYQTTHLPYPSNTKIPVTQMVYSSKCTAKSNQFKPNYLHNFISTFNWVFKYKSILVHGGIVLHYQQFCSKQTCRNVLNKYILLLKHVV